MPEIGVRELKARASEIVREMREHGTSYTITYRGRPVGVLRPVAEAGVQEEDESQPEGWGEFLKIAKELHGAWESPQTLNEILSEMRR